MPRQTQTVILQDGTEVRRAVFSTDGVLWITYYGEILIVVKAGKHAFEQDGSFVADRDYFRVVRKAVIS